MSKKATPRGRKATAEGTSQDDVGGSGGSGDRNPTEFQHITTTLLDKASLREVTLTPFTQG